MRGFSSLFCDNGPEKPCTANLLCITQIIADLKQHSGNSQQTFHMHVYEVYTVRIAYLNFLFVAIMRQL